MVLHKPGAVAFIAGALLCTAAVSSLADEPRHNQSNIGVNLEKAIPMTNEEMDAVKGKGWMSSIKSRPIVSNTRGNSFGATFMVISGGSVTKFLQWGNARVR